MSLEKRRVKLVHIDPSDFLNLFNYGPSGEFTNIRRARLEGLPKDAKVLQVWPDLSRNLITCLVESEEFDEIDRATIPQSIPVEITTFLINEKCELISQTKSWRDHPSFL